MEKNKRRLSELSISFMISLMLSVVCLIFYGDVFLIDDITKSLALLTLSLVISFIIFMGSNLEIVSNSTGIICFIVSTFVVFISCMSVFNLIIM